MLFLKYYMMFVLLGLVVNTSLAIGTVYWWLKKTNYDDEAYSDIIDIMFDTSKGMGVSIIEHLFSKEGRSTYVLALAITIFVAWPMNVAWILSKIPYIRDYIENVYKKRSRA